MKLGGLWPELTFTVTVVTEVGFMEVECCIGPVPFFASNDPPDAVCLWSDRELKAVLSTTQDWSNAKVLEDEDEQREVIDAELTRVLRLDNTDRWRIE